jgi:hypothetical protein
MALVCDKGLIWYNDTKVKLIQPTILMIQCYIFYWHKEHNAITKDFIEKLSPQFE